MKKKRNVLVVFGVVLLAFCGVDRAMSLSLFVDSAPNVYGSPDYAAWESNAFYNASHGTFVNMANSVNSSGTTNFDINDEVVYSFGDLGKRLTWIYWVEGETVASLTGRFKISLYNTWNGSGLDFYNYYYGSTWLEPTHWIDYDKNGDGVSDGVIGTAGMAWWGAYGTNTQAALDADLADWGTASESWTFSARLDGSTSSITSNRASSTVPEPATFLLFGVGLWGVRFSKKLRQKC